MELRPGYKQTEVGVIPEDWELRGLLEAVRIANGQVDPKIEPYRSMVLVAPDHIESGTGRLLGKKTAADQRAISGKYLFDAGDVVYSKIRPYLRKVILADFAGLCSADMYPLKPVDGVSGGYVLPLLLADRFSKYAESVSLRTGMPKINRAELADFVVPLPPPSEQRAIATALSDVDALIAGLEQLIAKKRDLKQAAMQQLLTGQTRLPGFSGAWEVKRLGELTEMGSGGTPLSSVAAYYDGDIPWVAISDMTSSGKIIESTERRLSALGLANSAAQMFPAGTVLYAMYASLGECSIAGVPLCTSQAILGIRAKSTLNAEFLYYYLSSLKPLVKTLGQQGTQSNLNKGMVQDFSLSLPSVTEQTAIAAVLSDMDAELAALEARLAKTRALKQGMMQELLTGRTRLV
ncbi:restriction endonuclease subunit S [Chromobacterium amazonense]|uniref:restriction endonuclease subunit S n=1 Tax=Chromobacterium amazonense TaxID=1382803 RepID=UPI00237DF9D0|nr:restriction endonuclease subunit S [Chromobacterium amazonense]MDE1716369.1 restriction endonuclease subunit S [Chromobacterium amazonense]